MKYILIFKTKLITLIGNSINNIMMGIFDIIFIYFLYKTIQWSVSWYYKNNLKKMPVYIFSNGDIDFDILNFDGENYNIVVDVNKFNPPPVGSGMVLSQVLPPTRHNIWMNKTDLNVFDVFKLVLKTFLKKHHFFMEFADSKTKLSDKSKSNLTRILTNSKII